MEKAEIESRAIDFSNELATWHDTSHIWKKFISNPKLAEKVEANPRFKQLIMDFADGAYDNDIDMALQEFESIITISERA